MQDITLSTRGLTKCFGGRPALCSCTLQVQRGAVCCLLGRNGAGKTTLLKLLLGLLRPTAGSASILGLDSIRDRPALLRQTGSLIETPAFYDHLSAAENLRLHLAYMGMQDRDPSPALRLAGLGEVGGEPVGSFSLGMRQRLAIARALSHRPAVLLLDEPLNGLDPVAMREMRLLFRQLAGQGVTILLSSHLLAEVEQTADRIAVLAEGRLVLNASLDRLRRRYPQDLTDRLIAWMQGGDLDEAMDLA